MVPIEFIKVDTEEGLKEAMTRMKEEPDTFRSADQMTEEEIADECFGYECEQEEQIIKEEINALSDSDN